MLKILVKKRVNIYNKIMEKNYSKLISAALEAQKNAYAPYSGFAVGASVLTKSGKIFCGANIENASYPAGICAERVAASKAISEGEKEIEAVCITCSGDTFAYPCGVCRQFLSEFSIEMEIIIAKSLTNFEVFKLSELLPKSFTNDALNK